MNIWKCLNAFQKVGLLFRFFIFSFGLVISFTCIPKERPVILIVTVKVCKHVNAKACNDRKVLPTLSDNVMIRQYFCLRLPWHLSWWCLSKCYALIVPTCNLKPSFTFLIGQALWSILSPTSVTCGHLKVFMVLLVDLRIKCFKLYLYARWMFTH